MSALARPCKIQRISPSVLVSLSHSFTLYLALPLCIIFPSLAFQKSYLYESCVAGALVSLSLLGYETGATQPPHARLSSGLSEDVSHPTNSKHTLSQSCKGMNIAGCTVLRGHQRLDENLRISVKKLGHCSRIQHKRKKFIRTDGRFKVTTCHSQQVGIKI